jgi:mono/diheme cytochrome c family protein
MITTVGLLKLHAGDAPVPDLKIAGTREQIQRGQAIANSFCGACHSRTGVLTGGVRGPVKEHATLPPPISG